MRAPEAELGREPAAGERPGGTALRVAAALAALAATGLGAAGRFRPAVALTLGAAVAIVSARWLSGVVARLLASDPRTRARVSWKFALGAALRYLFLGAAVYAAVRLLPSDVPWLLAGLSSVVAGLTAAGVVEFWREGRGRSS